MIFFGLSYEKFGFYFDHEVIFVCVGENILFVLFSFELSAKLFDSKIEHFSIVGITAEFQNQTISIR